MSDLTDLLVFVPLLAFIGTALGLWLSHKRNRILSEKLASVEAQLAAVVPRPDVSILGVVAQGGNPLVFRVEVTNRGSRPTQATVEASIAGRVVGTHPPVDLLANALPARVHVEVPRPRHGDLVKALNDAVTLYGETLTLTVTTTDGDILTDTWDEEQYDPETDFARYEAQQRAWRIGRGEETDADRRAEHLDAAIRQRDAHRGA